MSRKTKGIAVADAETDPFKYNRVPAPFVWGYFDGEKYKHFWGENCTQKFLTYLRDEVKEPQRVYFHNGGKFDFFFMLEEMENPIKIINGRIAHFNIGIHTFVDSWLIIPESLEKANKKTAIDYTLFEAENRKANKKEILAYLKDDCIYLHELVDAFVEEFGTQLTIGGTAMKELKRLHRVSNCGPEHDSKFREFYFGGRVQCFERGIIRGDFKLFDVNSMYPHVMDSFDHPYGDRYEYTTDFDYAISCGRPFFIRFEGRCADLPQRRGDRVEYIDDHNIFHVTGHEFIAALDIGSIQSISNVECWVACESERYSEFVHHFLFKKNAAGAIKDKIHRDFYKRVLNSAYGRFAINPEKFMDYYIRKMGEALPLNFIGVSEPMADYGSFDIWETPSLRGQYQDVAIGASITGAARAVLMRAKHSAIRPLYCDTDSLLCESFSGDLHDTRLGAWDMELTDIQTAAIAGRKMYALFGTDFADVKKYASKGCRISPEEIYRACMGEEIVYNQIAPNFSLRSGPSFISRRINATI